MKFEVGDWVVVMCMDLLPVNEDPELDGSSYDGLPALITDINGTRCSLVSPLKLTWGKPQFDNAPMRQLIKISKEDAEGYINEVKSSKTWAESHRLEEEEEFYKMKLNHIRGKQ